MDGPSAEGDGVILSSTGFFDRGAVAIVLDPSRNGIETYRFKKIEWDYYKDYTNTQLANALKDADPSPGVKGFEAFYSSNTSSPFTCTAW